MKMSKKSITILVVFIFISCVFLALSGGYTLIKTIYKMNYESSIVYWSEEYELDPYFVSSVIWAESKYNRKAESGAGAIGLMQIMPDTGEWIAEKIGLEDYSKESLYDADTNIHLGCWYLRYLSDKFEARATVCAAYNAGPNRVSEWLSLKSYSQDGINLDHIPYEETRNYISRIDTAYEIYSFLYKL